MTAGVLGQARVVRLPEDVERLVVLGDPHGDLGGVTAIRSRRNAPNLVSEAAVHSMLDEGTKKRA